MILPNELMLVAVIAPALVTVNALAPTANADVGAHVPIPTLPLVTTNPPCGVEVPIPTLAPLVVLIPTLPILLLYRLFPAKLHPATVPDEAHVVVPLLSEAVSTYPLIGVAPLMIKFVVLTVPFTSNALFVVQVPMPTLPLVIAKDAWGVVVPIPTLPPVNKAEYVAFENVGVPVNVLADVPLCV